MKKRAFGFAALAIIVAVLGIAAADSASRKDAPCGTVAYMVGKATVTHNGKVSKLDIDSDIYNNDMIRTEDRSKVEIEVDKTTGFSGKVIVGAKTSFYFKTSEVKGQPSTTLDLMTGQVGMKVGKLIGTPSAQVRTEGAICGVRGTEFMVVSVPSGDVLVTCDEGLVGLLGLDGEEAEAPAGAAVERRTEEKFSPLAVEGTGLEEFRDKWRSERIEALRANPMRVVRQFAGYYLKKRRDFNDSFTKLAASGALRRWMAEDEDPGFKPDPRSAQTLKDLKEVNGPILAIRKDLFLLERYLYRLDDLKEMLQDGPYWDTDVGEDEKGNSLTIKAFFKLYEAERVVLTRRIALYRYAERLHLQRNPIGAVGGSVSSGAAENGSFFDKEDGFFED